MSTNKLHFVITKATATVVALVFIFSCSSVRSGDPKLNAYLLTSSLPLINKQGTVQEKRDTFILFTYGKLQLFKVPSQHIYSETTVTQNGNLLKEKIAKVTTTYFYFIYESRINYGYQFDSITQAVGRRSPVDSFLNLHWITQPHHLYDPRVDSLIETQSNGDNVIETYIARTKPDATYNDTTLLVFSKSQTGLDFTFSKELDSLKKMKLMKVRLIYKGTPRAADVFEREPKELSLEMMPIPIVKDSIEIIRFFKQFKP